MFAPTPPIVRPDTATVFPVPIPAVANVPTALPVPSVTVSPDTTPDSAALVVFSVALCMVYFGYINFLRGFSSFRMPSLTPLASLYAAIPISGALIALFTVEQLVNGWRNGFDRPPEPFDIPEVPELIERAGGAP